MDHQSAEFRQVLESVFSDETAMSRSPAEPDPGDTLTLRVRMQKGLGAAVSLLLGPAEAEIPMFCTHTDAVFDWYAATVTCGDSPFFYSFLIRWDGALIHCKRSGSAVQESLSFPDEAHSFRVFPGFHVPAWAKGAVQYQIFTDRFCNGDETGDVREGEYVYAGAPVRRAADWDAPPEIGDYRCFYGGDLPGVAQKLDYLQSLGVETLYFNPIFVSPSSHKYDTQDYDHVDPHFAPLARDGDYGVRTTDSANLAAADDFFARLCAEIHRRGMRIILDGVFNHCGSFHRWMDREGLYHDAGRPGAFGDPNSPYRGYFNFQSDSEYEAWWGVETLPKLNYENSGALCEEIFRVAEKWASPPYCIDGWRLDVGADLGHSREYNHLFWKEFRRRVKAVNPDVLLLSEHYGDPSEWLRGDEWDSVMNYDAFMEPLTFFLTGMEKHSDYRRDDLYQNGPAFFAAMRENASRLPTSSLQCAMNELSNHDHSRFLTRTNGHVGRLDSAGSAAAAQDVRPGVMREAVLVQMTWPGAPTIYYGDEAGQVGWTDPDNRRTYPWGREDQSLIALHRALTGLRARLPLLRCGSVQALSAGAGYIAYARFDESGLAAVVCNNADASQTVPLPLRAAGVPDGTAIQRVFLTDDAGFSETRELVGVVRGGALELPMAPRSAVILLPAEEPKNA